MSRGTRILGIVCLGAGALAAALAGAQSFGVAKEKVTLQRKLPALTHLAGTTIKVKVTGHDDQGSLPADFQALLETELLKNDSRLRVDDAHPSTLVICQITEFSHPPPTVTTRQSVAAKKPGLPFGKNAGTTNQTLTRITGALSVSFQAKVPGGQVLISDNVHAKYDDQFDSSGVSTEHGVMGSVTGTFNRLKGGSRNEDTKPPTDSELRSRLMADAVRQIAGHIVNTDERVEVFLARHKGALDDGDKQAEAGLWERALETFETAPPLGSKEDDAYRLYNIGVAYEALAYQAEDQRAAMKYLEEAAINYGKAIDAKPAEKYFLEPQKRIETAIAHYKQLEGDKTPNPVPEGNKRPRHGGAAAAQPSPWGSGTFTPDVKALTNAQVIAMVKSGMDDEAVAQAIRTAKAVNFDLSDAGQRNLTGNGIDEKVLAAMKARAARRPVVAK